ncbi:Wadjet anti-phage system protein JetD domain-containing protein [Ornithinimicrobium sp. Y1847]|uniref:Wadjet anti-phage system protein JetD domain-containing protein n=1 Tax=Ornithinimicrobium sp. Y1847 TaxID=3405419 RepID=UPI003B66BFEA
MKTVDDTKGRVRTWLDRNLVTTVADGDESGLTVGLDAPTGQALQDEWADVHGWARGWRNTAAALPDGVRVDWVVRKLGPTRQELPHRLVLDTVDGAAGWVGGHHPGTLDRARTRWADLTEAFPDTADVKVLRVVMGWDQVDVDLLLSAAQWFADNRVVDDTWTPRQVPVPGLHAKWLDATGRRTLIEQLAGIPTVRLRARPVQARVTYLDPAHAATGRRRWDLITAGDTYQVPYDVKVVVVVENRDTAFYFPPEVPGGVLVLGNGDAAVSLLETALPSLGSPPLIYWGDIDAEGLRIVARLRTRGHVVDTILMDLPTYDRFKEFGTSVDQHGKTLRAGDPTPPDGLTTGEADLYNLLTSTDLESHRRVEQERIPLDHAVTAITSAPRDKTRLVS